jgi:hypothetical protein
MTRGCFRPLARFWQSWLNPRHAPFFVIAGGLIGATNSINGYHHRPLLEVVFGGAVFGAIFVVILDGLLLRDNRSRRP